MRCTGVCMRQRNTKTHCTRARSMRGVSCAWIKWNITWVSNVFVSFYKGWMQARKRLPEESHCPHNAVFQSAAVPRPALNNPAAFWRGDALVNGRMLKCIWHCEIREKANTNPQHGHKQMRSARGRAAHDCRRAVLRALCTAKMWIISNLLRRTLSSLWHDKGVTNSRNGGNICVRQQQRRRRILHSRGTFFMEKI